MTKKLVTTAIMTEIEEVKRTLKECDYHFISFHNLLPPSEASSMAVFDLMIHALSVGNRIMVEKHSDGYVWSTLEKEGRYEE